MIASPEIITKYLGIREGHDVSVDQIIFKIAYITHL